MKTDLAALDVIDRFLDDVRALEPFKLPTDVNPAVALLVRLADAGFEVVPIVRHR